MIAYERELAVGKVPPVGYTDRQAHLTIELAANPYIYTLRGSKDDRFQVRVPTWPNRVGKRTPPPSGFLCDRVGFVLGVADKNADEQHAAWKTYHRELLAGTNDPALRELLHWIDTWKPKDVGQVLDATKIKPGLNVVFLWHGKQVHELPAARAIWVKIQAEEQAKASQDICLVTGKRGSIATLHDRIMVMRVVGDRVDPCNVPLISYDRDACEHFGHEQGSNSPISIGAAHGYVAALNYLSRNSSHDLGGNRLIYWSEADRIDDDLDPGAFLAQAVIAPQPEEEQAKLRDAIAALAHGKPWHGALPSTPFSLLTLEGNTGRHAVRGFWRSTLGDLAANVERHLQQIAIDGERFGSTITELARDLGRRDADSARGLTRLPAPIVRELSRAVIRGAEYPDGLASYVLGRLQNRDGINTVRSAFLKAWLVRNHGENVTVSLNQDHPSVAYHLGRFLAAAESVRRRADIGSITMQQRYWSMLCNSTAEAVSTIFESLGIYLGTIRRMAGDAVAAGIETNAMRIFDGIKDSVPDGLTSQEQALMAIGYAHQVSAYKKAAIERAAAAKADASQAGTV
jgi:CRISPR-associated protein Csd1